MKMELHQSLGAAGRSHAEAMQSSFAFLNNPESNVLGVNAQPYSLCKCSYMPAAGSRQEQQRRTVLQNPQ